MACACCLLLLLLSPLTPLTPPLLPGNGGGAAGAAGPGEVLVSKTLTFSDVATDVARSGRIVLPRTQVQQCLPQLLRLGGAGHAVGSARAGAPLRLSQALVRRPRFQHLCS